MRQSLILAICFLFMISCEQYKKTKLTVLFFDNQNPTNQTTVDTLMKEQEVDFTETPIDIFFTNKNFKIPYYVPTDGIFKNAAKDRECDMKIYPAIIKCYEYDNKNRVSKMNVAGSGTINNFIYEYNEKNQIVRATDLTTDKFVFTYNANGTLSEVRRNNIVSEKRLVFIYN